METPLDPARRRREDNSKFFALRFGPGAALALLLVACATTRDPRTPAELKRDAEVWTRAKQLRIVSENNPVAGCTSLGIVSERYFEDPPSDPLKRPMVRSWPEHVLRYKTASLGGDTAYLCPTIRRWSGELNESRVLGEAYRCDQASLANIPSGAQSTRLNR